MAAVLIDGSVHLTSCLGQDDDGDQRGQWFNTASGLGKLSKRAFRPAWKDPKDQRETWTWANRPGLYPLESCWKIDAELVPRFKLLPNHCIPEDTATTLEEMMDEQRNKKKRKKKQ